MELRVLEGGRAGAVDAYSAPATFDLQTQPVRPGLAHEQLELALPRESAIAISAAAVAEGVPRSLWAGIAIESERAFRAVVAITESRPHDLEAALDEASAEQHPITFALKRKRLIAYACQLRERGAGRSDGALSCLSVPVGYHTFAAWEIEASQAGKVVEAWALELLLVLPTGRTQWEAAAAESGQTLAEWIAFQAARLASC